MILQANVCNWQLNFILLEDSCIQIVFSQSYTFLWVTKFESEVKKCNNFLLITHVQGDYKGPFSLINQSVAEKGEFYFLGIWFRMPLIRGNSIRLYNTRRVKFHILLDICSFTLNLTAILILDFINVRSYVEMQFCVLR